MQSNMPLHTRAAHIGSSSSQRQNQQTAFSFALSFKKTRISKAISPQWGKQNQVYMRPQIHDNRTLPKNMEKKYPMTQCCISGHQK